MAFGAIPKDSGGIPIGVGYIYGDAFWALRSGRKLTDGSSNASSTLECAPTDGFAPTYSAAMQGLVPVTACTDLFTIYGSATKTVKITRMGLVGTTITTPIQVEVQIIKRSAVNVTGTSSAPTNLVAHDSASAAATATVLGYTANPGTLGTVAGIIVATKVLFVIAPTATLLTIAQPWVHEFGIRPAQAPVLRGVAQGLCINLVATTLATACACDVFVEWTEDNS